jgi:hypothetical protein
LEKKNENALRRKATRHRQVIPDDTVIVASTTDRTKRKLTKRFDDTDISWAAIEKQLLIWSDLLLRGKELTLKIINCGDYRRSLSAGRKGEKRGKSSVTQKYSASGTHSLTQRKLLLVRSQFGAVSTVYPTGGAGVWQTLG